MIKVVYNWGAGHSFGRHMRDYFEPVLDDAGVDWQNADVLLESVYCRSSNRGYDRAVLARAARGCRLRIFVNWEAHHMDPFYGGGADLAIFNRSDYPRGYRNPFYYPLFAYAMVKGDPFPEPAPVAADTPFCNAVISNRKADFRREMLEGVRRLGEVLDGGAAKDGSRSIPPCGKRAAMAGPLRARFNLCPENTFAEGYATEKAADAFLTRHVPIWAGSPGPMAKFINEGNTIILNDAEAGFKRLRKVMDNPSVYADMLAAAPTPADLAPLYGELVERVRDAARRKGVLKAGF